MIYKKIHLVYFSPTHTSLKTAMSIAEGLNPEDLIKTDLTLSALSSPLIIKNTLTIIALPVYGGRCAEVAMARLRNITAKNSPAILIVTYGNRDYEDALIELRDYSIQNGFIPIAGGAFIGEHSYSRKKMPIAEGRPDKQDLLIATNFGKHVYSQLECISDINSFSTLYVKGCFPYKIKKASTPMSPETDVDRCILCGTCVNICPTNAITIVHNRIESDKMKCIKCCACVKICPHEARIFNTPYTEWLYNNFSKRKEPELFYAHTKK